MVDQSTKCHLFHPGLPQQCYRSVVLTASRTCKRHGQLRFQCRAENDVRDEKELDERLKAAEKEAASLRKQLEAAQTAHDKKVDGNSAEAPKNRTSRIDGAGLQRETPFATGPGEWLSEATFLIGKGPSEAIDATTESPEQAATVKKRLVIGTLVSAAAVVLSLIPTDALRLSRPSKPLFFYLLPLIRVQHLLSELEQAAIQGDPEGIQAYITRIQGAPNFAVENLRSAAAALPNPREAEKARVVARDVIEYLDSIDYNKYFENLQKPGSLSGDAQQRYYNFSLNSVRAAKEKLQAFLSLMPHEQLEAAEQQANARI